MSCMATDNPHNWNGGRAVRDAALPRACGERERSVGPLRAGRAGSIMSNAWRARIGLISPTARGKGFAFWYRYAPEGVEIIPTFIGFRQSTPETFEAGFKRAEELAAELKSYGCNLVVVSGTPPFLLRGPEFERE